MVQEGWAEVPLAENEAFVTLSESVPGNDKYAASAQASFANKRQCFTLKQ